MCYRSLLEVRGAACRWRPTQAHGHNPIGAIIAVAGFDVASGFHDGGCFRFDGGIAAGNGLCPSSRGIAVATSSRAIGNITEGTEAVVRRGAAHGSGSHGVFDGGSRCGDRAESEQEESDISWVLEITPFQTPMEKYSCSQRRRTT